MKNTLFVLLLSVGILLLSAACESPFTPPTPAATPVATPTPAVSPIASQPPVEESPTATPAPATSSPDASATPTVPAVTPTPVSTPTDTPTPVPTPTITPTPVPTPTITPTPVPTPTITPTPEPTPTPTPQDVIFQEIRSSESFVLYNKSESQTAYLREYHLYIDGVDVGALPDAALTPHTRFRILEQGRTPGTREYVLPVDFNWTMSGSLRLVHQASGVTVDAVCWGSASSVPGWEGANAPGLNQVMLRRWAFDGVDEFYITDNASGIDWVAVDTETMETEANDTQYQAMPLGAPAFGRGTVVSGDGDYWSLTNDDETETITYTVVTYLPVGGATYDLLLQWYNTEEDQIGADDDSGESWYAATVVILPPSTSVYFKVKATHPSYTGDYIIFACQHE